MFSTVVGGPMDPGGINYYFDRALQRPGLTLGTYSHVSPAMHREPAQRMDALFTYRRHAR